MSKKIPMEEQLFIVLIPEEEILNFAVKVQRTISEYYNLYRDDLYPQLHITLDKIIKEGLEEARDIVNELVSQSEPITIKLDEFSCFYLKNDRHLVLKVARNNSLDEFAVKLHKKLKQAGISTIDNYDDWIFHITIVNNRFAENPIPLAELKDICLFLKGKDVPRISKVNRIEIWRPVLNSGKKRAGIYYFEK